eukprot:gene39194-51606_t
MAELADDVVQKCKYIHPARAEEVEQLLIKLRKHVQTEERKIATAQQAQGGNKGGSGGGGQDYYDRGQDRSERDRGDKQRDRDRDRSDKDKSDRDRGDRHKSSQHTTQSEDRSHHHHQQQQQLQQQYQQPVEDNSPPARLQDLDEYLEMMYQVSGKTEKEREEGLNSQIQGSAMILKLCRDVMNLENLIQNSTVMGALTRVLQEEYKRSVELTFNILSSCSLIRCTSEKRAEGLCSSRYLFRHL